MPTRSIRIVGINAHWSRKGKVPALLEEVLEEARKEAALFSMQLTTSLVHLSEQLPGFFRPEDTPIKVRALLDTLLEADAWFIGSPIIWGSKPDCLQTLTSHLTHLEYPDFQLRGKPFGVIAHGKEDGGRETCLGIAAPLLVDFDMVSPPGCLFYKITDGADRSEGGWMLKNHRMIGQNIVRYVAMARSTSIDHNNWNLRDPR